MLRGEGTVSIRVQVYIYAFAFVCKHFYHLYTWSSQAGVKTLE